MILGTSKILSKSGPVDLLIITKMRQRIQEKYGIILGKYYVCQSGTHMFLKMFENVCPRYNVFCFRLRVLKSST